MGLAAVVVTVYDFSMDGFLRVSWGDEVAKLDAYQHCREHAKTCGASERSVVAQHQVMCDIGEEGQALCIEDILDGGKEDGFLICKKVWGEASVRMQMDRDSLATTLDVEADTLRKYTSKLHRNFAKFLSLSSCRRFKLSYFFGTALAVVSKSL